MFRSVISILTVITRNLYVESLNNLENACADGFLAKMPKIVSKAFTERELIEWCETERTKTVQMYFKSKAGPQIVRSPPHKYQKMRRKKLKKFARYIQSFMKYTNKEIFCTLLEGPLLEVTRLINKWTKIAPNTL